MGDFKPKFNEMIIITSITEKAFVTANSQKLNDSIKNLKELSSKETEQTAILGKSNLTKKDTARSKLSLKILLSSTSRFVIKE